MQKPKLPSALPKAPCPFCGETSTKCSTAKRKGFQVECISCGARGPIYGDEESAFNGWRSYHNNAPISNELPSK